MFICIVYTNKHMATPEIAFYLKNVKKVYKGTVKAPL